MKLRESELLGCPEADLFPEAGQVDADHRGNEEEFRREVAVGHGVDGVRSSRGESKLSGNSLRVKT